MNWFRKGFCGGLAVALLLGLFLLWLWRPEHQIQRHSENLFRAIEHKNWQRTAEFIGSEYQDQWGHDRDRVVERARQVLSYLRNIRIKFSTAPVRWIDTRHALWISHITIEAGQGEVATLVKERINSLATPFELKWQRVSAKPWDWKLVGVSNSSLDIPATDY